MDNIFKINSSYKIGSVVYQHASSSNGNTGTGYDSYTIDKNNKGGYLVITMSGWSGTNPSELSIMADNTFNTVFVTGTIGTKLSGPCPAKANIAVMNGYGTITYKLTNGWSDGDSLTMSMYVIKLE